MPRPLTLAAIGLALLVAAFGAGYWAVSRVGAEQVRVVAEESLSSLLEADVSVAGARLDLARGARIEASGLTAWRREENGPGLEARRVSALVDPIGLLRGELRLRSVRIDGARLQLVREAPGQWWPIPVFDLETVALDPTAENVAAALLGVVRGLLGRSLAGGSLELRDASLTLEDRVPPADGRPRPPLEILDVEARLVRRTLPGDTSVFLSGRLAHTEPAARFELEAKLARDGALTATLALTAVPLTRLAAMLDLPGPRAGSVSGVLEIVPPEDAGERYELDLVIHDLEADWAGQPQPLAVERAFLTGTVDVDPGRIEVRELSLRADRFQLAASGGIRRPLSRGSTLWVALSLPRLDVASLSAWAVSAFGGDEGSGAALVRDTLRGGRLGRVAARGRTSVASWTAFLQGRSTALPDAISLSADLHDVTLAGGGADIVLRSGRLAVVRDTLDLSNLQVDHDGDPLPILDIHLENLPRLADADLGRLKSPAEVPALPGLRTAWEWVKEQAARSGDEPGTERIELALDWLDHPALLWPVEGVRATLRPLPEGVDIDAERGTWGGFGLRGSAHWQDEPERLSVHAELRPPRAEAQRDAAPGHWLRGRISLAPLPLGVWRLASAGSDLDAYGAGLRFERIQATLRKRGRLTGRLAVDLRSAAAAPFEAALELQEAQIAQLTEVVLAPDASSGDLDAAGTFAGHLRPGEPLARSLSGDLFVQGHGGTLRGDLPLVVAIQTANDNMSDEEAADPVGYDEIYAELRIEEGTLHVAPFSIDGPELRLLATGEIDILSDPHAMQVVLGLFFYRDLDRMLSRVPVLNSFLLGSDDNLFGAYFVLTGPWDSPQAQRLPNRTFAGGPMGFMMKDVPVFMLRDVPVFVLREGVDFVLEDVPDFVKSGIRTIQSSLVVPGPKRGGKPAEAERGGS